MINNTLFVDIEWNQFGMSLGVNDEIIEIGAYLSVYDGTNEEYFSLVRTTKPIKKSTFNFLKISPYDFKNAKKIKDALLDLKRLWDRSVRVFIWTQDSWSILTTACNNHKVKLDGEKVIIFQDILKEFTKCKINASFEKALLNYGALYDSDEMHNALFDAMCLKSLCEKVYNEYEKVMCKGEQDIVKNKVSNRIHMRNCRYIRQPGSIVKMSNPYELFVKDQLCKCCMRVTSVLEYKANISTERSNLVKAARKLKGKRVDVGQIQLIADYFEMDIKFRNKYVLVDTDYSSWKIYLVDGFVISLKHENYKPGCRGTGFHDQLLKSKDMFTVMQYIVLHDSNPHKKSKVEIREKEIAYKDKKKKLQKARRGLDEDELEYWKKHI